MIYLPLGVSKFLVAPGALGVLGAPGVPGTSDAPGSGGGLAGVAGGPIGAEPDPRGTPCFGSSLPGAFVPGWEPGTGEAGCANAAPVSSAAAVAAAMNVRMVGPPLIKHSSDNGDEDAQFPIANHALLSPVSQNTIRSGGPVDRATQFRSGTPLDARLRLPAK